MTGFCKFEGCDRTANIKGGSRGFCSMHYQRFMRHGDASVVKLDRVTSTCSVAGCERGRPLSRGLCQKHYARLKNHGTTEFPASSQSGRKIRWLRGNADYQGDDCLTWPFQVGDNGRGVASLDGRQTSAPRIMCILAHGQPEHKSLHASHSCGKGHEGCVNPRHLSWKTPQENEADKRKHGTLRKGENINTAVLTEADVRSIRRALMDGRTGRSLAAEYGVTPSAISNIKNRQAWAWLE
jgi:hypothetical protein